MHDALRKLQRRRRLPWLAAGVAAACLLLVLPFVISWLRPREKTVELPSPPIVGEESSRDPDGKPLRRDFPLEVRIVGARKDAASGVWHIDAGQLLSFSLQAPQACFVAIWYENEDKSVTQLFPNERDRDNRLVAGSVRWVPGDRPYQIRMTAAKSVERLRVLASTLPIASLRGQTRGNYQVADAEEADEVRGVVLEEKKTAVTEHVFAIRVDKR
jgi:hypothetical protein